ncbi:MAG: hypothetical protein RJB66_1792 [Pseudomonadota bacterium]
MIPKGLIHFNRGLMTILLTLTSVLCHGQYHAYPYALTDRIELDPEMLAQEMINESNRRNPDLELSIEYSFKKYRGFLMYMAGDNDLKTHYFKTFHSEELVQWILSQPENSIAPHHLFAVAVEISKGDILEAVTRIHETLRNYARGLTKYTYPNIGLQSRNELFNKFMDIRGDLHERDPKTFKGDHYGSWYRLWALMAFQMASKWRGQLNQKVRLKNLSWISYLAEVIKVIMPGFRFGDKRKTELNLKGAKTGYYLNQKIQQGGAHDLMWVQGASLDYLVTGKTNRCVLALKNTL